MFEGGWPGLKAHFFWRRLFPGLKAGAFTVVLLRSTSGVTLPGCLDERLSGMFEGGWPDLKAHFF
ncbi:MAG: hypothetical protein ACLGXA_00390, partial [Acidobacteriota bacterium]